MAAMVKTVRRAMGFQLPGDQPNAAAGPIWTATDPTKAALIVHRDIGRLNDWHRIYQLTNVHGNRVGSACTVRQPPVVPDGIPSTTY
jgi:hypothetical protein